MRLERVSIVLIGMAALGAAALATPPLRTATPTRDRATLTRQANAVLDVTASELQELQFSVDGAQVSTVITIDGKPRTLELLPHSNRADDFQVLVQYELNGPLVEVEPPPVLTYKGTVAEWPDAEVRASFDGTTLTGAIYHGDESIAIQTAAELGLDAGPAVHVVHKGSNYLNSLGHTCGVEDVELPANDNAPAPDGGQRGAAGGGLRVAEIGFDADEDYYDNFNNVNTTVNQIEDLLNSIEPKYEADPILVTYEITTIIVRTAPGAPYTTTSPGGLLDQFEATWDSAPENAIRRDTSHLITGKNLAGTTLGIASTFTGCQTFNSYGLTQAVVNFNTRVGIAAHELGHNWGALHCDGCNACGSCCRIMCSGIGGCSGLISSFGCNSENAISGYVNAQSCLTDLPPVQTLPFCDDFEGIALVPERWLFVDAPSVTAGGVNPPSGIFALTLDASGSGEYSADEIRSNFVNMDGESNVVFSYYTQHRGVEAGESLFVEYLNSSNDWVLLNTVTSDGADEDVFTYHEHVLPFQAYHSEFRMRFRVDVNSSSDDWFVDDVSLDCFPPPNCEEPCSDGDACTTGDQCVDATTCGGTVVDCSGASTECSEVSCNPAGADGNCDLMNPVNEGGTCDGGDGYCDAGACADATISGRVFMAADGQQNAVNAGGPTTLVMSPNETATVGVFLADNTAPGPFILNSYQIIVPYDAAPQAGATGTVSYVDDNPGNPGGGSVFLDTMRNDWVYADEVVALDEVYSESLADQVFGVFYSTLPGSGVDAATLPGVQYLVEFEITASPDAEGEFLLPFNLAPSAPPLAALFNLSGTEYVVDQYQPLRIVIGDGLCGTIAECADLDGNNIRDDNCVWWACTAGQCLSTDVVYGDMAGQFGACPPDGTADGNDRFAALNCFADTDSDGEGPFPCEDSPPMAFNVDAGGQFGSCDPDGVCDGNDAFAALNAFGGTTTCSCPLGGPAPTAPAGKSADIPAARESTSLRLVATRATARPGDVVEIDVLLDGAVDDLRGYQLHLAAEGGRRGALELIDIATTQTGIEDPVTGQSLLSGVWTAFNLKRGQMVAGTDDQGSAIPDGTHLATFTYRASKDATGRFVIRALHDDHDPEQRTYLFPTAASGRIEITGSNVAVIDIASPARRALGRTSR